MSRKSLEIYCFRYFNKDGLQFYELSLLNCNENIVHFHITLIQRISSVANGLLYRSAIGCN